MNNNRSATKASKQQSEYCLTRQRSASNYRANTNRATQEGFAKNINKEIAALLQEGVLEDKVSPTKKRDKIPQPKTKGAENPADQWMKKPRRR